MDSISEILIGLTTLPTREAALTLGNNLIEANLAFCVQIDSPITSIYKWEGTIETSTEYRLVIKFLSKNAEAVEAYIHKTHPYKVPQWLVIPVTHAGALYKKWVEATSIS